MDNTFKQDLEEGHWAEELFVKTAREKLNVTNIKYNTSSEIDKLREWDIELTQKGITWKFEVKWDKLSSETGNFAIEFFGRNSASGIAVTKADYWVILSGNEFYIFKTAELRDYLKSNPVRSICIKNGTAYVYLVPITSLKTIYKTITATWKH